MGPCRYCHEMIYDDAIAERGYHRECREKAMAYWAWIRKCVAMQERDDREQEKRRLRRAQKRREAKLAGATR